MLELARATVVICLKHLHSLIHYLHDSAQQSFRASELSANEMRLHVVALHNINLCGWHPKRK